MLLKQIEDSVRAVLLEQVDSGNYRRYRGPQSEQLVASLMQRLASTHVLLTSSGTAALEIVLRAAGLGKGDEVVLSAYDYPGNFWAIERTGARPVLVDVEAHSWRMDPSALERELLDQTYPAVKAVVVSHLHGQLHKLSELRARCEQQGLLLIEDACQAFGATLPSGPAGAQGHAGIVSFGGGKTLSAGRGGALVTSDPMLAQKVRLAAGAGSGPYALSELQAAVINAQVPWLPAIIHECRQYFQQLQECLQLDASIAVPFSPDTLHTSFYQAGLLVPHEAPERHYPTLEARPSLGPENRLSRLINLLVSHGIVAGRGFDGFHRRTARRCRRACQLANAAEIAERTLAIHHSAALSGRLSARQLANLITSESPI